MVNATIVPPGGLDLSYDRGYYEDVDFCMRADQLGYECVMLENMFVYHIGSQSFKSDPEQKVLIRKNIKIFEKKFRKHNYYIAVKTTFESLSII